MPKTTRCALRTQAEFVALLGKARLYVGPYSQQNRARQWFDRTDQAAATHGRILTEGSFVCIGGNSRSVATE